MTIKIPKNSKVLRGTHAAAYIHGDKVYKSKKELKKDLKNLKLLNSYNIDFIPKLLDYDIENNIIVISNMGKTVSLCTKKEISKEIDKESAEFQIKHIVDTLRKYKIYHHNVKTKNMCILNGKINLIDMGRPMNKSEKEIDLKCKYVEKVLNRIFLGDKGKDNLFNIIFPKKQKNKK